MFAYCFVEQGIRDVLSDSAENNTLLRRDYVFAHLNFSLKSGKFTLFSEENDSKTGKGKLIGSVLSICYLKIK